MKPDELVVGWVEYILKCPLNGDGEKGKEKEKRENEGGGEKERGREGCSERLEQ